MSNKKAYVFSPLVVVMTFAALLFALTVLSSKYGVKDAEGRDRVLGLTQATVFKTYNEGENARLYVELAGKFSAENAIMNLAQSDVGCGNYYGYAQWFKDSEECFPTQQQLQEMFISGFNNELNEQIRLFTDATIPEDNYDLVIDEDFNVMANAKSPIVIGLGAAGLPSCIAGDISKLQESNLKKCVAYSGAFSAALNKFGLGGVDSLILMSVANTESGCDPGINAGGIMQVDRACLLATPREIREDPAQIASWACPTPEAQIEEGTKVFATYYDEFRGLPPNQAIILTLFAYNRGADIAKKAKEYVDAGASVQDAMYQACVNNFLTSKSTVDRTKTWEEYFNQILKATEPEKYKEFATATDYYCVATGPRYPVNVINTYETACKQIGGTISESGSTGGRYAVNANFKFDLDYSFSEFDLLSQSIRKISQEIEKTCPSGEQRTSCIDQILAKDTIFLWNQACDKTIQTPTDPSKLRLCAQKRQSSQLDIVYKIAILITDKQPPKKVQGLVVADATEAEHKIIVSFNQNSEDNDVAYYNIYYSKNQFTKLDEEGISPPEVITNTNAESYSNVVDVKEDGIVYVAVTAVDSSGNEGEVGFASGESVDDLNPSALPLQLEYSLIPETAVLDINLFIAPPPTNIDGSSITGLTSYRIFVKKDSDCSNIDDVIRNPTKTETRAVSGLTTENNKHKTSFRFDEAGNYCVVVIAEDTIVEDQDEITSNRYSQNSAVQVTV
jgi:hypothetical protein